MNDRNGHAAPPPGPPARSRAELWLLGGLFAIALAWLLRSTASLTLPLAAALLIALALAPVSTWVQHRVPRALSWLGYVAAMLIFLAILGLFIGGLSLAVEQVVEKGGRYVPRLEQQLEAIGLSQLMGGPPLDELVRKAAENATSALGAATSVVAGLVLLFFFVLLMLIEAPRWHDKLCATAGRSGTRRWEDSATAIGEQFRRYLLLRMLLGAITGALYAGFLALFGIEFLLVWALLAFVLNLIPTVGSIVAGLLPVLFVFATRDAGTALAVGAGILAIEQVMGNYVDPRLVGRRLSISPVVVFASLLFWSWVWGPAGALIAAPMTALLTVLFAHVRPLKPIALYLSNERDMEALERVTSPRSERSR